MSKEIYQRTSILIGVENVDKLKDKTVVVCGIGGVGSYTTEAISRAGIGNIIVIDKDVVDITNINRQIIALSSTIGKDKVNICKDRIQDINNQINVTAIKENITKDNITEILKNKDIDYVVDAVDNIEAKIAIIKYCYINNIKCISSMGMGNKLNPLDIKVDDINKTIMCPLAKVVRNKLKELDIKRQKVVYSIEQPIKSKIENTNNILGSISFVPSVAGLIIASEVVKDLIQE